MVQNEIITSAEHKYLCQTLLESIHTSLKTASVNIMVSLQGK